MDMPKVTWLEGRIDRPDIMTIQHVQYRFVVRHTPDRGTKVPHMHMVITTTLSHKKLRKAVRAIYGLTSSMQLMFRPYDDAKIHDLVRYYIDHDQAEILASEEPFATQVTQVRNEIEAVKQYVPLTDAELSAEIARALEEKQRYVDIHREQWGIEPPDCFAHKYVEIIDVIETLTKHWSSNHREWEFKDYCRNVIEYLVWPDHDEFAYYRHIYSEFRFRGDIKLLYARYWGVTPSLLQRIFGYLD